MDNYVIFAFTNYTIYKSVSGSLLQINTFPNKIIKIRHIYKNKYIGILFDNNILKVYNEDLIEICVFKEIYSNDIEYNFIKKICNNDWYYCYPHKENSSKFGIQLLNKSVGNIMTVIHSVATFSNILTDKGLYMENGHDGNIFEYTKINNLPDNIHHSDIKNICGCISSMWYLITK